MSTQNKSSSPKNKAQQVVKNINDITDTATLLSKRYEQLLNSEKYYDCIFLVDTSTFKSHKLLLSAASPVFEAMFYGPIRESSQEIKILDISPNIFLKLLRYIYTGRVNFGQLNLEETIEFYYCAEKYLLQDLISDCIIAIKGKLRFANILPALELSVCMNLQGLLEVCMTFFTRCCLSDTQYMTYLKENYLHVSKECIKAIIAANQDQDLKHFLWFVMEWCQQECLILGLQKQDCNLVVNELQLNAKLLQDRDLLSLKRPVSLGQSIERSYYRACRPFIVGQDSLEWSMTMKCDRFISLLGITINSRLMPAPVKLPNGGSLSYMTSLPSASPMAALSLTEYKESLHLEIKIVDSEASNTDNNMVHSVHKQHHPVIWRHSVWKQPTKYNCHLNIAWDDDVILSPDFEYQIKLIWQTDAYGAEYPCSLQSDEEDGIKFRDCDTHCGSLIKGMRFLNLV